MGPEGGMAPPGGQNTMGTSGNEAGMYPTNRYAHQRWEEAWEKMHVFMSVA